MCELFGVKRQAYYQKMNTIEKRLNEEEIVLELVIKYRSRVPSLGGKKLHYLLKQESSFQSLFIGRDRLFAILRKHDMLIRKKKKHRVKTTNSNHWMKKYPNLIKDLEVTYANQVWVSDITYIKAGNNANYLFLVTDVYSSKIMGYCLGTNMTAEVGVQALNMAISNRLDTSKELIHHSDRGSQYCSYKYTSLLKSENILISMTENGDPYENPKAERVNGILKEEFEIRRYTSHLKASTEIAKAIEAYNNFRPHLSCDYLTPEQAHHHKGKLKKQWKNYYRERMTLKE